MRGPVSSQHCFKATRSEYFTAALSHCTELKCSDGLTRGTIQITLHFIGFLWTNPGKQETLVLDIPTERCLPPAAQHSVRRSISYLRYKETKVKNLTCNGRNRNATSAFLPSH